MEADGLIHFTLALVKGKGVRDSVPKVSSKICLTFKQTLPSPLCHPFPTLDKFKCSHIPNSTPFPVHRPIIPTLACCQSKLPPKLPLQHPPLSESHFQPPPPLQRRRLTTITAFMHAQARLHIMHVLQVQKPTTAAAPHVV